MQVLLALVAAAGLTSFHSAAQALIGNCRPAFSARLELVVKPTISWVRAQNIITIKKGFLKETFFYGGSGGTRTHYPQFRKLLLYPDELRRQTVIVITSVSQFCKYKFHLPKQIFLVKITHLPENCHD